MTIYGPRDAASVLMHHKRRVARVWRGSGGARQFAWMLDGRLVTLWVLENEAEKYERLKDRQTSRVRAAP